MVLNIPVKTESVAISIPKFPSNPIYKLFESEEKISLNN